MVRVAARQRPARDRARGPGRARQALRAATRDARRRGSRRCSASTSTRKGLRDTLVAQYLEHASRSSKIENQLWQALFDLSQGFLACYARIRARSLRVTRRARNGRRCCPSSSRGRSCTSGSTRGSGSSATSSGSRRNGPSCTRSSRSRARARSSAIRWSPMPRATRRRSSTSTWWRSILQLVNSGNMTPKHVDWVASHLDEWCQPLRLTLEPSSVTSFYVDLGSRAGLRRRSPAPLEGRVLFLDTRPLHALLMQNVAVLEQKIKSQPLSDKTARRSEQLALVTKLASQVDPEFKPFARRGERTSAAGTVDAIVGFAQDLGLSARGRAAARRRRSSPGTSFGGTMELAVFGRARNEARSQGRAGAAPPRHLRRAGRSVGSEGREPDRVPAARADERRQRGDAGHAGRDPPAGPARLGARHRPPDAPPHLRPRGNRPAGHRERALERRPRRAAQGAGATTTRSTARRRRSTAASSRACSCRCASARPTPRCSRSSCLRSNTSPRGASSCRRPSRRNAIRLGRLLEQQPEWVWTAVEPLERRARVGASAVR